MPEIKFPGAPGDPQVGALVTEAERAKLQGVPEEITPASIGAATEAQGTKADSAVQPGDLATVATTGAYEDLTGRPSIPSTPGDIGAATAAQGALADSAVQPGDLATVATTGSYESLTDKPPLGSASTLDAGTGAGELVQLDGSGRLPAVDGSLLIGLPGVSPTTGDVAVSVTLEDGDDLELDPDTATIIEATVTGTATVSIPDPTPFAANQAVTVWAQSGEFNETLPYPAEIMDSGALYAAYRADIGEGVDLAEGSQTNVIALKDFTSNGLDLAATPEVTAFALPQYTEGQGVAIGKVNNTSAAIDVANPEPSFTGRPTGWDFDLRDPHLLVYITRSQTYTPGANLLSFPRELDQQKVAGAARNISDRKVIYTFPNEAGGMDFGLITDISLPNPLLTYQAYAFGLDGDDRIRAGFLTGSGWVFTESATVPEWDYQSNPSKGLAFGRSLLAGSQFGYTQNGPANLAYRTTMVGALAFKAPYSSLSAEMTALQQFLNNGTTIGAAVPAGEQGVLDWSTSGIVDLQGNPLTTTTLPTAPAVKSFVVAPALGALRAVESL